MHVRLAAFLPLSGTNCCSRRIRCAQCPTSARRSTRATTEAGAKGRTCARGAMQCAQRRVSSTSSTRVGELDWHQMRLNAGAGAVWKVARSVRAQKQWLESGLKARAEISNGITARITNWNVGRVRARIWASERERRGEKEGESERATERERERERDRGREREREREGGRMGGSERASEKRKSAETEASDTHSLNAPEPSLGSSIIAKSMSPPAVTSKLTNSVAPALTVTSISSDLPAPTVISVNTACCMRCASSSSAGSSVAVLPTATSSLDTGSTR
eukprot:6209763-Pleurochrysis_carterae.AAC.1